MEIDAERLAKAVLKRLGSYRYHRHHASQARSVLRTLEEKYGKMNPAHIKLADAYARDVLGHARYAPWLYVYSAVSGVFKEGWIPDNYYGSVVVPAIKGGYGKISDFRCLQSTIFRSAAFPDVAYFVNGLFLTPDNTPVAPHSVKHLLFAGRDEIVFKVDNSLQGRGVFFFHRNSFDLQKMEALGNGVFQERIVQHEALNRFAPGSVATLRMTTAVDDNGQIALRACYLRLGRADDTHVQSKSHVRVAVDLASGELAREGYLTNWLTVPAHPDTNVEFSGTKIPAFAKCVAMVLAHHRNIPLTRSVGWDVAIGRDEAVKLMEWNASHNDIKFSEATQGPCFTDLRWDRFARERCPNATTGLVDFAASSATR
ncbi:MAG: sugar-transfer associated ATP-grasp family protein [Caballeronia mineralivorans]|jgi:hypothetical protein|nr:sugar-transfer associated ATP-grasp family protein [Caballeronia mineralivorans]MEA3095843.1 hypothetical protein [Caballeronia mineralivorans]